jgi:hypothetical protein
MKARNRFFACALSVGLGAPSRAADDPARKPSFHVEALSSAEEVRGPDGTWIGRTVRSRFDFVPASAWAGPAARLLLHETFVREERSDREGAVSRLDVTALKNGAKPYDTKAWSLRTPADEISFSFWGDFLETIRYGCCGAEDLHRFVDLESGRVVAVFSEKAAFLAADDRGLDRVVSYLSMMASREETAFPDEKNAIGVLSLSSRAGTPRKIVLTRSPVEDMGTPKVLVSSADDPEGSDLVRLVAAKKGRAASEVVSGVTVTLDWGSGFVATIPVTHDGFDLDKAVLPKGFSAQAAR